MAHGRYENTPTKKGDNGKRVTRSILYPPIPKTSEDIYVITTPGDRADLLAYKYYGSVNYAWVILEANGIGRDTYVIAPGTQLRIPANIGNIMQEYMNLNQ